MWILRYIYVVYCYTYYIYVVIPTVRVHLRCLLIYLSSSVWVKIRSCKVLSQLVLWVSILEGFSPKNLIIITRLDAPLVFGETKYVIKVENPLKKGWTSRIWKQFSALSLFRRNHWNIVIKMWQSWMVKSIIIGVLSSVV